MSKKILMHTLQSFNIRLKSFLSLQYSPELLMSAPAEVAPVMLRLCFPIPVSSLDKVHKDSCEAY